MRLNEQFTKAIELLKNEKVVAIPTETVYGLAGNIYSEKAIEKIFELKKRPKFNPLIVHIASVEQLPSIAKSIPPIAEKLATHFWPGPLTLVLEKQDTIPDLVTGGLSTVAVRVPNHPVAQALLNQLPFPLAAPSANPFKRISPTTAAHVTNYFGDEVHVLDGGSCDFGIESTIIGFENEQPILYRLGSITLEQLQDLVGPIKIKNDGAEHQIAAPGMLLKHYSPITKFILTDNLESEIQKWKGKRIGVIQNSGSVLSDVEMHIQLESNTQLTSASKKIFAALHELDTKELDVIIAQKFEDKHLGKALNDRLSRASK